MTSSDWQKIEAIVLTALAKPEGERGVHLSLELGTQPHLLASARRLVRMASRPQSNEALPELQSGWRLVMPLGMDGLGIDYLAERADGGMENMALLKVSRVTLSGTAAQQQFVHDLRTLATLYDSGVARMLDSGWISLGRPFVVVEFDAGVRITDAARDLELPEKVSLFRKVLAAVQYGHLKKVLHGDLRPENVLVIGEEPRLYDFGLTRLLTTGTDSIAAQDFIEVENIAYSSPEQIRGLPLTEQCDVYALGVIFYEMLLGRRPYGKPGDDALQMGRAICEQIPAPIGTVNEDLNFILLKALEKNPTVRYPSVAAFAADLQAYQEGKPVAPRQEQFPQMLMRSLQQHWMTVALLLSVVLVGAGALFYKGKADARSEQIQSITKSIFPGKGSAAGAGTNTVQSAKKYLDDMLEQNSGKPEVVEELAKAYLQLAEVELKGTGILRGNRGAAIQSARKSYELSNQLLDNKEASDAQLIEYARSAHLLTEMLTEARDYNEALKIARQLREKLGARKSTDPRYLKAQAEADQAIADLLYLKGDKQAAMPVARVAMQQFAAIFSSDKGNAQKGQDYARSANNVGSKALELKLFPEAITSFNLAAGVLRPQAAKSDAQVGPLIDLAKSLNGLGQTLARTNQGSQARASFLEARQILEQAAKRESTNEDVKQILADNYLRAARLGRELADYASAIAEIDRAVEMLRKLIEQPGSRPEYRRDLARALTVKGEIFQAQGKRPLARDIFSEALRYWQAYANLSSLLPEETEEWNRLKESA